MYEVKKQFSFATDGIGHKVTVCKVGEKVDLKEKLGSDLEKEGFVVRCAPENKRIEAVPETKTDAPKKRGRPAKVIEE